SSAPTMMEPVEPLGTPRGERTTASFLQRQARGWAIAGGSRQRRQPPQARRGGATLPRRGERDADRSLRRRHDPQAHRPPRGPALLGLGGGHAQGIERCPAAYRREPLGSREDEPRRGAAAALSGAGERG